MQWKRAAAAAGAVVSLSAVTACTVDGTATRGPIQLDTGKYATSLQPAAGTADTESEMNRLRAMRLGEDIAFRDEVDPVLTKFSMPTYPISGASGLRGVFSDAADLPVSQKLRYGFTMAGGAPDDSDGKNLHQGLNHAVLVYPDAETAGEAVSAMSGQMLKKTYGSPMRRTDVPGMPAETVALTGKSSGGGQITVAFTPVAEKVVYTWADADDGGWTLAAVRSAFTKQKALLDAMKPISDDKRIDPNGLLRAVLPTESNGGSAFSGSVAGPRAISQLASKSTATFADLQKTGVTEAAVGGSLVFRAGGDDQAAELLKTLSDDSDDPTAKKADSPQDLPSAVCQTSKSSFGDDQATCFVAYGSYAAQADGSDLHEAQQKISAQYLLLKQL
ncbi:MULTISPECIES: DUF7373 family lipoprotein [Gordonia]|uniref:Secreted protein n=1 Tax=Gordonia sihwensis NBRC 108236 TaxID=1223544 RepID=L7LHQ6_9ACTN|nr:MULTISPECIES: PTS sugar transporter subunit IIA [Gordonia]AUH69058.1 hypothetical protein CXX93_12785 [Gordonia sp. YC-JH1]GAC59622.1 hypothetical protein GSI01S_03_00820 [Gordonia sihwensis NBRC 108236]